jgi:hypothetical protein
MMFFPFLSVKREDVTLSSNHIPVTGKHKRFLAIQPPHASGITSGSHPNVFHFFGRIDDGDKPNKNAVSRLFYGVRKMV